MTLPATMPPDMPQRSGPTTCDSRSLRVNQDNLAKLAKHSRAGRTGRQDGGVPDLVHTSDAAKALGISARSIARWAAEGRITPDLVTPGGHMRWNIANLRRQLEEARKRDS